MVGGISTDLRFKPAAVTRFFNKLTSSPAVAPSRLDVNAEFAVTRPDPNRSGQAYLEEFEGDNGVPVSLRENLWEFCSKPQFADGVTQVVGAAFDTADAVQMTWQNLIPDGHGGVVELRAKDIDPSIQVAGSADQLETVLYITLHADTAGGIVEQNNHSRWSLPARPNHAALAFDGDRAQQYRCRSVQERVSRVLGLSGQSPHRGFSPRSARTRPGHCE